MKKLLGLILTLIIIMALASCDFLNNGLPNNEAGNSNNNGDIPEFDDSEYSSEGVVYAVSVDGTYALVVGYKGNAEKVKIDSEYNGLPVKSIYWQAFSGKSTITNIIVPDSVTSIDKEAFYGCTALDSIIIGKGVTSIDASALFTCVHLTNISVSANNQRYKSVNGNLYSKDGKTLERYTPFKSETEFIIPDGVTAIGSGAFGYSVNLTSIIIPSSVTSIGASAFGACYRLTSIIIPDGVTSIGSGAFANCLTLASITIPDNVTSIGGNTFSHCYDLTSIVIPDSVTSIGNYAFEECSSLTSLIIPDSVTSIAKWAFDGCDALADVYYTGSEDEWSKIIIGNGNEELQNATIHYEYVSAE